MNNTTPRESQLARCMSDCAGGRQCSCTGLPHRYHVCSVPTCECHMPVAYGLVRVGDKYHRLRRLEE